MFFALLRFATGLGSITDYLLKYMNKRQILKGFLKTVYELYNLACY